MEVERELQRAVKLLRIEDFQGFGEEVERFLKGVKGK
jgi:hypothetical protein